MGQGTSEVRRTVSSDGGATWSRPAALFKTPGAFVKNQALWSADHKVGVGGVGGGFMMRWNNIFHS